MKTWAARCGAAATSSTCATKPCHPQNSVPIIRPFASSRLFHRRVSSNIRAGPTDREKETYPYNSGDPNLRQKATIEHVFGELQGVAPPASLGQSPWQLGYQMNERNLVWNDALKVALIKRIASDQLGLSDEEMEVRLHEVAVLLPGLVPRLLRAPPTLVARVAAHTSSVAQRLLTLKTTFPGADVATLVSNRLGLLLGDEEFSDGQIAAAGARLRELLPGVNVDAFVADFPLVLDVDCFERALADAARIMPGTNPVELIRRNPSVVLGLVTGRAQIPYDEISNPWS